MGLYFCVILFYRLLVILQETVLNHDEGVPLLVDDNALDWSLLKHRQNVLPLNDGMVHNFVDLDVLDEEPCYDGITICDHICIIAI